MKSLVLFFSLLCVSSAFAEVEGSFRTPAKVYGSGYSIKLTLRRDGFTYDVPVWIKPDQKVSTLDRDQLNELGWVYKDDKPEEIVASGETFDLPKFQNKKSDWAYLPDFAKACCYGIIGQDVLKEYVVKFDPNPPAHLEWVHIPADQKKTKPSVKFEKSLGELFSLRSDRIAHKAFVLNLSQNKLDFEPEHFDPKGATKILKTVIFHYEFVPPKRLAVVTSITGAYAKSAKAVGLKTSMKIASFNSILVATLNHFEINDFLTGRRAKELLIKTDKDQSFTFDFEKNEFIETQPVQTTSSRN